MPLYPATARAQVVFENETNVPADRVVNTWHFLLGSPFTEGTVDALSARLVEFYNDPNTGGNRIAYYLSTHLQRGANKCQVRVYDLNTPEPREPHVREWTLQESASTTVQLPNECAACLSFYSGGRNLPRQRGRVYIGPLSASAIEQTTGDASLSFQCRKDLGESAKRLADHNDTLASWAVLSRTGAVTHGAVDQGWVDNAVDIQRRRGRKATVRTDWAT